MRSISPFCAVCGKEERYYSSAFCYDCREVIRRHRIYKITKEQYDTMYKAQGGLCKMCHKAETRLSKLGKPMTLSIDHDHRTGKIRALLCQQCNMVVGYLEKNQDRVRMAAEYLNYPSYLDNQLFF